MGNIEVAGVYVFFPVVVEGEEVFELQGPMTAVRAMTTINSLTKLRIPHVMYESPNGLPPVLEVIMELLYKTADG